MPTEIENIEGSEVDLDKSDKMWFFAIGAIVVILILLALKIFL